MWSYGTELWGYASKSNIVIMQRSQSKILRAITNAPRYVTNHILNTGLNIPYLSDVLHERINKNHNNLEAHPNPLLEPLLQQTVNTRILKICWPLDLQGTWGDSLPRPSNTWYRSVLCIIITLAYSMYSFWFLINNIHIYIYVYVCVCVCVCVCVYVYVLSFNP